MHLVDLARINVRSWYVMDVANSFMKQALRRTTGSRCWRSKAEKNDVKCHACLLHLYYMYLHRYAYAHYIWAQYQALSLSFFWSAKGVNTTITATNWVGWSTVTVKQWLAVWCGSGALHDRGISYSKHLLQKPRGQPLHSPMTLEASTDTNWHHLSLMVTTVSARIGSISSQPTWNFSMQTAETI